MYAGIITKIKVKKHPNANKLAIGFCEGYTTVTSLDMKNDTIGVFFPSDGKLTTKMCYHNSLFRKGEGQNKDSEKFGLLDSNGRIKAITLRGVTSEGLFLPIESLSWAGDISILKPGDEISSFCEELICEKYISKEIEQELRQVASDKKLLPGKTTCPLFAKIGDTKPLQSYARNLTDGSLIFLTEKLHGTSGRTAFLPAKVKLTKPQHYWNKVAYWVGLPTFKKKENYTYITGTKNTTTVIDDGRAIFERNMREKIHNIIKTKIRPGETFYYEIVGYNNSKLIMPAHAISDKEICQEIRKKFNTTSMIYDYGCAPGDFDFYIYKITITDHKGNITTLPTWQSKARAEKAGFKYVPVLESFIYKESETSLNELFEKCTSLSRVEKSTLGEHLIEGVCLTIESTDGNVKTVKYKGAGFRQLESDAKSNAKYIDEEEVS